MDPSAEFSVATARKRDSLHWNPDTVTWAEVVGWLDNPASKKECGNYLLGELRTNTTVVHKKGEDPCTNTHRRKDFVMSRSMLALDVDHPEPGFADEVELTWGHAAILHTTYSSSPDDLRYRLLIPTDRDMAPDEYIVAAKAVMAQLGTDQFDPGTSQPERYMFKPSAQEPGWFFSLVLDGDPLPVDSLLDDFEEDLSTKAVPRAGRNRRDPFEIEGVIGAFNKAYADWDLCISTYDLPYDKVGEDRYQLQGARSTAGMGPVQGTDGLVYSHHANDPAFGRACSAFDLVRLHRFGQLDEGANEQTPVNRLPSHTAMLELATTDHRVTAQLVGLDFDAVMSDETTDSAWKLNLKRAPRTGEFVDCIGNWDLIRANDPVFQLLAYNQLSLNVEATGDLPWRTVTDANRGMADTDRWELCYYLERQYGIRPSRPWADSLVNTRAQQSLVNPVRDYLDDLVWDGTPRVETCLPGVVDTPMTRVIARKCLVAAVARMYDPGCKWDHTLVLYGNEGLGKTWWINHMSRGFSSDLGPINDKDTLLKMQRSWIVVSDEGRSLRKGDAEAQKEFLTRTEDVFRMPYDRETLVHPRHCVIWSTTNDETFLRRQEGNRRFLIVHCQEKVDFTAMTPDYVDQLWAEAVFLYRAGETLFLSDEESRDAAEERERFVEEDALAGIIQEYLETPVPLDWWDRSPESRRMWLEERAQGFVSGDQQITQTCSTQIWVEAMGRRLGDHLRVHLLDINNTLKRIPGWRAVPGRKRLPGYGPQMVFVRTGSPADDAAEDLLSDLI